MWEGGRWSLLVCCNVPVSSFLTPAWLLQSIIFYFLSIVVAAAAAAAVFCFSPFLPLALSLSQMHTSLFSDSLSFNLALTIFTQLESFHSIYLLCSLHHTLYVFKAQVSKHVKTTVFHLQYLLTSNWFWYYRGLCDWHGWSTSTVNFLLAGLAPSFHLFASFLILLSSASSLSSELYH